jgi:SAM-dependent methyltransferase
MAWFKDWFNTSYYHTLYGQRDENEAKLFINNLLNFLTPHEGARFLDLACGKGRHSLDLSSHGYYVCGVDLSTESIAEAKTLSNSKLEFDVHDMRKPYKQAYFDYVCNLFTSFGYFDAQEDNLSTLSAVCQNLKPKGVFVQDFFNAYMVQKNLVPFELKSVDGIDFEITKEIIDKRVIKTIRFKDQNESFEFQEKVSLFDLDDFKSMYQNSGLNLLQVFGDYQLNPFDFENSDRLILITEKR